MKKNQILLAIILITLTTAKAQTFVNYTTSDGLPDNYATGVAIDKNNNKWIGTTMGVAKYNDTTWSVYTTTHGLVDNYTNCIAVDKQNHIWVGTNSGVSMFNGTTWTTYTTSDGLIDNGVYYIAGDIDSSVWFATMSGVSRLKGTTWRNFTSADGLSSDAVNYIAIDSLGVKWFGTQLGGVSKYNNTSFTIINKANTDSLLDDYVTTIAFDKQGRRWIGTYYGITILDASDNWLMNITDTTKIYSKFIRDIDVDSRGNVWVGMFADYNREGGVSWFNGTQWLSYSTPAGLIDKQVIRLAIDHNDIAWIATGNGVSKLSGVTGINDITGKNGLTLYPNPCDANLYISYKQAKSEDYRIFNAYGQEMIHGIIDESEYINTSGWQAGLYFIKIGNTTERVFITH